MVCLSVYNVLVPPSVKMGEKGAQIRITSKLFGTGFSFSDVIQNTKKFSWHGHCIKSDVFFTKFEQIRRYLQIIVILTWRSFFFFSFLHVVNNKSVKREGSWLRQTDYEGRIWKSFQYKYCDEMENRCAYVVIFYFCL